MILSLLMIPTRSSRADIFGAGDAALLAQQVAQFVQDFTLDDKKWSDIKQRLQQVDNIAKTITQGKQAYSSIHSIVRCAKQIVTTARCLESYIDYLEEFGDNFRIDRAHIIYKSFCRRSNNLYKDVTKTLKSFDSLTDLKPLELLKAVDEATSELSESVSDMSEGSTNDMVQLCHGVVIDQIVDDNNRFRKLNIAS